MTSTDHLFAPHRFVEAIERIALRRGASSSEPSLQFRGVSFATIRENRNKFARLVASDLLDNSLSPEPGRMFYVKQDGKKRRLFDFPIVELIIHDVVAEWLGAKVATVLSGQLYSYRPGTSYRQALRDFARYARAAKGREGTADSRGLYVFRRDIRSYFDSIPVGEAAPLWSVLARLVGPPSTTAPAWNLLGRTLRPLLIDSTARLYRLEQGIPTGSPVANIVANIYLGALDDELAGIEGGFYARYGDDVVAAHPDADVAATMALRLATHIEPKGLEFNAAKMRDLYLSTAPHRGDSAINADPVTSVEFLGHRVSAHGTVSLSVKKTRVLLDDLRIRAFNAAAASVDEPAARLAYAVRAINRLFDPHGPAAHPYANLLRTTVTDRAYLEWLDHEVGLIVAGAAYGTQSPRHFRRFPPKMLRTLFGLRSLVIARNRMGRGCGPR